MSIIPTRYSSIWNRPGACLAATGSSPGSGATAFAARSCPPCSQGRSCLETGFRRGAQALFFYSAWFFGARVSRMHAIIAALAAAIWFEVVYFAPHTLSEPLATALIVPAALLLTGGPSPKRLGIGGARLALALVWRFQYAPAMAV